MHGKLKQPAIEISTRLQVQAPHAVLYESVQFAKTFHRTLTVNSDHFSYDIFVICTECVSVGGNFILYII